MLDANGNEVVDAPVPEASASVSPAPEVADPSPVVAPAPTRILTRLETLEAWLEEHVMAAVKEMNTTHPLDYLRAKGQELLDKLEGT